MDIMEKDLQQKISMKENNIGVIIKMITVIVNVIAIVVKDAVIGKMLIHIVNMLREHVLMVKKRQIYMMGQHIQKMIIVQLAHIGKLVIQKQMMENSGKAVRRSLTEDAAWRCNYDILLRSCGFLSKLK